MNLLFLIDRLRIGEAKITSFFYRFLSPLSSNPFNKLFLKKIYNPLESVCLLRPPYAGVLKNGEAIF
jgi:hypothetical protein